MNLKAAVKRAYVDRYVKPQQAGMFGIDPAVRTHAREVLNSRNPDYEAVLTELGQTDHIDTDPGALRTLASTRLLMGQPKASIDLLEQAEGVLDEERAINYATRAMSYIDLRELDTAVEFGRRAIAVYPQNHMGYVNLGAALIEQGNLDAAFQVMVDLQTTWPDGLKDPKLQERILGNDGQWAHLRAHPSYSDRLRRLFPNLDSSEDQS